MGECGSCEICGKICKNASGLAIHKSAAHGISRSSVSTVPCSWCGTPKQIHPCHSRVGIKHFCCRSCSAKANARARADVQLSQRITVTCAWCGNIIRVAQWEANRSKHFFCSHDGCYAKWLSENNRGEQHPNWAGGVSKRSGMVKWAAAVKERDGHICVRCGAAKYVVAHHIRRIEDAPELRCDISNGVTLCRSCHADVHGLSSTPDTTWETNWVARRAGCDGWAPTPGAVIPGGE